MAISRPVLLALLGVILLGATALAVQNARDGADSDATPAAVQTETAPAQPTSKVSPADMLTSAFSFNNLESAGINARLAIVEGDDAFRVRLSGAFERGAPNDVPKFEVDVLMFGQGERVRGGFVSLGEEAFFARGDTGWRVPAEAWGPVTEAVGKGAGLPFQIHPATWVRDVKTEGSETVAGVETEHLTAAIDARTAARDLAQAFDSNGGDARGARALARSVKSASLDAWVGSDDRILRRLSADLAFRGGGHLTLDARLSGVNEPQRIEAPARVMAGAPGGYLGQFAGGLVKGATGGKSLAALTSLKPRRAARAVKAHHKVVILFRNPRGLDDRQMEDVMRVVDRRTNALVLVDHVDAVDRYGKLVEDLGIAQTPSVVIIDRQGKARPIEGFVDSDTLTQAVTDAR
jgi:hypothetical protein